MLDVLYSPGAAKLLLYLLRHVSLPGADSNWGTCMNTRIVVTGMGCVSPLGHNVAATWEAIVAGKSGAGPITAFDASRHETRIAAEVKGFDAAALLGRKE